MVWVLGRLVTTIEPDRGHRLETCEKIGYFIHENAKRETGLESCPGGDAGRCSCAADWQKQGVGAVGLLSYPKSYPPLVRTAAIPAGTPCYPLICPQCGIRGQERVTDDHVRTANDQGWPNAPVSVKRNQSCQRRKAQWFAIP